jgi:hypothetical protein
MLTTRPLGHFVERLGQHAVQFAQELAARDCYGDSSPLATH